LAAKKRREHNTAVIPEDVLLGGPTLPELPCAIPEETPDELTWEPTWNLTGVIPEEELLGGPTLPELPCAIPEEKYALIREPTCVVPEEEISKAELTFEIHGDAVEPTSIGADGPKLSPVRRLDLLISIAFGAAVGLCLTAIVGWVLWLIGCFD
jgi:hypothetical protein